MQKNVKNSDGELLKISFTLRKKIIEVRSKILKNRKRRKMKCFG